MSLSGDREILRRVWEGRVAARITLAEEDLSSYGEPDPHYLMLPRISYFPLVLDKVRKSFQRHVCPDARDCEVWLDYDGMPLKMQYPIGVLCDVLNTEGEAPWPLRLHFSNRPASLISLPSRESVESHFLSCVKEADALKHRGTVMGGLQSREHKQLWQGLLNDKFDQFWSVNQRLMESPSEGATGGTHGSPGAGGPSAGSAVDKTSSLKFRSVPFRLHLPLQDAGAEARSGLGVPVMRLQPPASDGGRPLLLRHLLHDTLSDLLRPGDRVVVQGIEPPLDTPLLWLSQHLSHPDNFLHLCVRRCHRSC